MLGFTFRGIVGSGGQTLLRSLLVTCLVLPSCSKPTCDETLTCETATDDDTDAGGSLDAAHDSNDATSEDVLDVYCPVGAKGCACTAGRACDTNLYCHGGVCEEARCGDRTVEGTEFCDDGRNLGLLPGDCAPDCSAIVGTKRIIAGQDAVSMDFARNGVAQLVATVDANCPAGYKAMFADGLVRIATLTPNKGDGQKNWVLRPWTRYINAAGQEIWTTNSVALLGLEDGIFKGLRNWFWGEGRMAITGMRQDWTILPSAMTCHGWTSAEGRVQFGSAQSTDRQFLAYNGDIDYGCVPVATVYCVEQ